MILKYYLFLLKAGDLSKCIITGKDATNENTDSTVSWFETARYFNKTIRNILR